MVLCRLVILGYSQVVHLDFEKTYAPVVRIDSVRLLNAVVASFGFHMLHADAKKIQLSLRATAISTYIYGKFLASSTKTTLIKSFVSTVPYMALSKPAVSGTSFYAKLSWNMVLSTKIRMNAFSYPQNAEQVSSFMSMISL